MAKKLIYPNLPEMEKREFISKLIHAMNTNNQFYYDAARIVQNAETGKVFDNIKFFDQIYTQNEPI